MDLQRSQGKKNTFELWKWEPKEKKKRKTKKEKRGEKKSEK